MLRAVDLQHKIVHGQALIKASVDAVQNLPPEILDIVMLVRITTILLLFLVTLIMTILTIKVDTGLPDARTLSYAGIGHLTHLTQRAVVAHKDALLEGRALANLHVVTGVHVAQAVLVLAGMRHKRIHPTRQHQGIDSCHHVEM